MLFRLTSVRCLGYGSYIQHSWNVFRRPETLSSLYKSQSLSDSRTITGTNLTLHNSTNRNNGKDSLTTKHVSILWHVHHQACAIYNFSSIRSFSTCARLEHNVKRRKTVNKSNRKQSGHNNTVFTPSQITSTRKGNFRPRRVKPSLITSIILSERELLLEEQVKSTEIRDTELDDLLESANPDNDEESTLSDTESGDDEIVIDDKAMSDEIEYVEDIEVDNDFKEDEVNSETTSNNYSYGGVPDPTAPISDTPCSGCGALLHCQNISIPGYMPSQRFLYYINKNPRKLRLQTCQRCYLMNTHNIALKASVTPEEYKEIIAKVKTVQALVVVVVDVMDMPNSIFPNITELIGKKRPLYIVGNKADLLPQDSEGYLRRVKEALIQQCDEAGLTTGNYIKHVALVSAKTGFGIEALVTTLLTDWARKGHVYILGCTNVGKSSLFNALLSSDMCNSLAVDFINRATTSLWPGTTLNLLRFPLTNPEPWKLIRRAKRLNLHKNAEDEERQFLRMKAKEIQAGSRTKYPTLMGHIGKTFEGSRNIAVSEEDSKGWSGPSFSFDTETGGIVATDCLDRDKMEGFVYDETQYANSRWCYDTPGVVTDNQILTELTQHELSVVLTQSPLVPRTFILKPGQAMHLSGLTRIDYVTGEKSVYFTVFTARRVPVSVREIHEMDDFYQRHVGTWVMGVPLGDAKRLAKLPALVGKDMTVIGQTWKKSVADIILSSIGWVAVTPGPGLSADLRVYTPGGRGCTLRTPALLPYAINMRGKRTRSAAYQIKPLRLSLFNSH